MITWQEYLSFLMLEYMRLRNIFCKIYERASGFHSCFILIGIAVDHWDETNGHKLFFGDFAIGIFCDKH